MEQTAVNTPRQPVTEKKSAHYWLVGIICFLIIVQLTILSPSPLEQAPGIGAAKLLDTLDLYRLLDLGHQSLIPNLPDRVPEYVIHRFSHISSKQSRREWHIKGGRAYRYHTEGVTHVANGIEAHLYGEEGPPTLVTGKEAKFNVEVKELEVYGDVFTQFPDGFTINSQYLRYFPQERKVFIPENDHVDGRGPIENGKSIIFKSRGLDYRMDTGLVTLTGDVFFTMEEGKNPIEPKQTHIQSDICFINRADSIAKFNMYDTRSKEDRFVKMDQPHLNVLSRKVDLYYGGDSYSIKQLTAFEDVQITETSESEVGVIRTGTSGRADFDNINNLIILTDYPQIYQNQNTVIGEKIVIHRNTDIVEVEYSNAYSKGK